MNKAEAVKVLNTKGFHAHDTDGILYVDSEDLSDKYVKGLRELLKGLGYTNSWGVKKQAVGVMAHHPSADYDEDMKKTISEEETISKEPEIAKLSVVAPDASAAVSIDPVLQSDDIDKTSAEPEMEAADYGDSSEGFSADDTLFGASLDSDFEEPTGDYKQYSLFDL